jgi:hypothetical protein
VIEKMKTIGYFDGTPPDVLTNLVADGYGTLPLANEWDGHGKNASHLEPGDVDLVMGYLHKLMPPGRKSTKDLKDQVALDMYRGMLPFDLLYPCKTYGIPVLVIVPTECQKEAKELLGEAAVFVTIVTPEELQKKAIALLKKK